MVVMCSGCTQAVWPDTRYCSSCGTPETEFIVICSACGASCRQATQFCISCGHGLNTATCYICYQPNSAMAKLCIHCGTHMVGKCVQQDHGNGKWPRTALLVDRYEIIGKIADGGMGAVYRASDRDNDGREIAIKEMDQDFLKNLTPEEREETRNMFQREYHLLNRLSHPNLVKAHHYFEEQDGAYFAMEYLYGTTLEETIEGLPVGQLLPIKCVLNWGRQLSEVLDFLHNRRIPIIYRDLKLDNIIELVGTKKIKLVDLGIARFYKPGRRTDTIRFGTEGYLAPEIVEKEAQTSPQSDVYALGVVLHQLLTGLDPTSSLIPYFPPVRSCNPSVPVHMAEAIKHALHRSLEKRTPTAAQFARELSGV